MANDPRFVVWRLEAASAKDLARWRGELAAIMNADALFSDEVITIRDGRTVSQRKEFRAGDYFATLGVLPKTKGDSPSLRLFFECKVGVARSWKDVMAFILKGVKRPDLPASLAIDYRVDDEQMAAVAANVDLWFARLGEKSRLFWQQAAEYLLDHSEFTFLDLSRRGGISVGSLRAMHRNSQRAIRNAQAPNPLWSKSDRAGKGLVYTMAPVVRDKILCLTSPTRRQIRSRSVA